MTHRDQTPGLGMGVQTLKSNLPFYSDHLGLHAGGKNKMLHMLPEKNL